MTKYQGLSRDSPWGELRFLVSPPFPTLQILPQKQLSCEISGDRPKYILQPFLGVICSPCSRGGDLEPRRERGPRGEGPCLRCSPALAQAFLFWQKAQGVQEPLTRPDPAAEHGSIIQKKKYKCNANGLCFKGHVEKREHFQTQVTEMIILKWEI